MPTLLTKKTCAPITLCRTLFDPRVAPAVAAAVAKAAMETGVARVKVDPEVVRANALKRIGR